MRRWVRAWGSWLAAGLVLTLLVTLAIVSSGFDSRKTPREDPSVWVMRSSGQYARVNTETAEIDTVRVAESPSGLVETDGTSLLLTQGFGRAWQIDPADPKDVRDDDGGGSAQGAGLIETPEGTRQVLAEHGRVLYFTEGGEAFLASSGRPDATVQLEVRADAVALNPAGQVAVFSRADGGVRWFDGASGEARGSVEELQGQLPGAQTQLAIVDGKWALFDVEQQLLFREGGSEPVELDLVGDALLQRSSAKSDPHPDTVLIADEAGLLAVGESNTVRVAEANGTPARPRMVDGEFIAAWISSSEATLWASEHGVVALDLDPSVDRIADPVPVITTNGDRAVVAETSTGMMWRVPDGQLIPISQWSLSDPPKEQVGDVTTEDVTEQEPPVAIQDSFGVRAGEPAMLPVLLNDYDPNRKDVLTIVPEALGEDLPNDFGQIQLLSDGQNIVMQTSATAEGSAKFKYRITDGVHLSPPATVTVKVASPDENSAPKWCPVEGCQRAWPSPEVTPGGTLQMPVLEGWVDPQGDPLTLSSVEPVDAEAPVRALITEDGRLALRHTDSNADEGEITLRVTVTDARGDSTQRKLSVQVNPKALAEFAPMASTVEMGETVVLQPLNRLTGGSGAFALVDALVQANLTGSSQAQTVQARVKQGARTVELSADRAGSALLAITARDVVTEQEITGVVRVTVVDHRQRLALPPMRAFVRPLADSTVEVLDAIPSASTRALSVQSASVVPDSVSQVSARRGASNIGSLRADVIEHSRIRVSGSTGDGLPGRIGSIDVVVEEGKTIATGRLTVFQVAESSNGAIAVADTATVRTGSVVDIPVLDNDISPPGERLLLSPEVSGSGAKGELAFASGSKLRYLAPKKPGNYTLSYNTYSTGSPELGDSAQVRITVLPTGSNRDPEPPIVTARVAPGQQVTANVPLSGVDPDGDRVRLVAVEAPADPQLSASIEPRSSAVHISASRSAASGTEFAAYTVRDDFGGEATGVLRIIVTDPDPSGGGPVAYSDYVRIAVGSDAADAALTTEAVVRPLDNDLDPSGGTLEIVKVVPNVSGSTGSAEYLDLARRLDLSQFKRGVVRIASSDQLGTVSYRYTVRSSGSTSTADGLIVVQSVRHVGQQAPNITDTVLSVSDRATLAQTGIDVVTGRVRWAAGDISQLKLSLWGAAAERYSLRGNSIVGAYRAEGDLVPFRLAGFDPAGAEVEGFGFLIVPPLDELRLTLKPGLGPLTVNEDGRIDAKVSDLLDLGPGDRVELALGKFVVQRGQAQCTAVNEQTLRYTAGKGAPWSDSCTIRVRLSEQRSYTSLPVRVNVVPGEPVAVLNPLMRTISPGGGEVIDLLDMLEWQGDLEGRVSDLRWVVTKGGSSFEVKRDGSKLNVRAHADARPGAQELLDVTVSGGSTSRLTLRVGEAARDAPRGGAVSLSCNVGSACSTPLVGVAGEHDPFSAAVGGGLHVVSLDSASCAVANLSLQGDKLRVTWPDGQGPGGSCTATFTVNDAQDRTGTGTIELDALGVPRAPTSVKTDSFTESSVTLRVTPGEAAHPDARRMLLRSTGSGGTTECTADGATYLCPVGGLTVGEKRTFVAVAVNDVGKSAPSSEVTTWAYRKPPTPTISKGTGQVNGPGTPTVSRGTVRFVISGQAGSQKDVKEYQVMLNGSLIATLTGSTVDATVSVPVGQHNYRVVPVSNFSSPIDGANLGEPTASSPLTVVGLPKKLSVSVTSYDQVAKELTVSVQADANLGGSLKYGAAIGDTCNVSSDNNTFVLPLDAADGQTVRITVCAQTNTSIGMLSNSRTVDIKINAPEPDVPPVDPNTGGNP